MFNLLFSDPVLFVISVGILLVSIAWHEFCHALVADRLGDPTPRARGRLTLNPLKHLDPLGTLFILFWGFGWGKPVPYDPFNLRRPDRDAGKIALAGPLSSLLLAGLAAAIFHLFAGSLLANVMSYAVVLNVYLGVFNLVPIHPLDGYQALAGLLNESQREDWYRLRGYGLLILLFLLFPLANGQSPLLIVLRPIVNFILNLLIPAGNIL